MAEYGIKKCFITGLDEISLTDKEGVGTLRFEGNNVYKYVRYDSGTADLDIVPNDCLFYSDYAAGEVTADVTDSIGIGAGVSMATITATAYYFWIKIKGISDIAVDVVAGAVGNALTAIGTNDKTLDVSAVVTDHVCAYLLDDTASAQQILCDFPF